MTAETRTRAHPFIDYLRGLTGAEGRDRDRAALAALRRLAGRGPGSTPEADRRLMGWTASLNRWEEARYYLVAGLFARYPEAPRFAEGWRGEKDLGASFAQVARATSSASTEKRFMALLAADAEDLGEHLRHAISLMRAHQAAIDWEQLLSDLGRWDDDDRRIQARWARSYWGSAATDTEQSTEQGENPDAD